ncbi:hypothetical protein WBG78_01230 [Chryseolinea sp. T2]|uniref:hypothetical protein n=1 Tax=Chryseolinea sp. T2 TaxID=3129255 RepID=UPI0030786DF2
MMRTFLLYCNFALLLLMSSCSGNNNSITEDGSSIKTDEVKAQKETDSLGHFSKGKELGLLKSKKLEEVSGLAASVANPGMLWTHNDSGNAAEVYLIDQNTSIKMTCVLQGANNRDWEDIAIGPGPEPGKQYIYVGDIGDNLATHLHKFIYRFEEPVYSADAEKKKTIITKVDKISFSLSDERRDSEAFFIDPKTRDIYVISKWKSPVDLYQLKYTESKGYPDVAQHIGTLPISTVVASDFSRDGTELLVKTYSKVFYFKRSGDMTVQSMLKQRKVELPYKQEPQGEAIAWSTDGKGYYTLSEQQKNEDVHLLYYERESN